DPAAPPAPQDRPAEASPPLAASQSPPPPHRALRIMLVEDHRDTASLMSRVLVHSGHVVQIADSLAAAMDLAQQPFDVLVSDLGLPDGDGCDLMRRLAPRGVRGIALSGLVSEDDVQRCHDAGFAEHLAKPVNIDMLLSTIAQVAATH